MLASTLWILLVGFLAGQIARRLKVPPLVGMVLAGIVLGPQLSNVISPGVLSSADSLRTIAVMVILMKAGLGLDREKLMQQGTVALRLGFLPGACEMVAIAVLSVWLLNFDILTGLLLGCIIGAESPAVIVPGMLRLKRLGWGVKKGIPDAILTGSALSDVLLLLVFSLLLAFLSQSATAGIRLPGGITLSALQLLPFQVVVQIALGVVVGWLSARLLSGLLAKGLLAKRQWTQNTVQDTLVTASCALFLVVLAERIPIFSGYLAVMSAGFFLIELDAPLARNLRNGFNSLWVVAEIILFVLLGANIQLGVLGDLLWVGLLMLVLGTLVGRSLGWYLSTMGSNWTPRERLFLLPGNSAKATVQAAIGAIPLAYGLEGGEAILALSALSILVTAPLGAWAIPTFAPRLLERGEVDPTKVAIAPRVVLLAAVDATKVASQVLTKAAARARCCDGEVIVVYAAQERSSHSIEFLQQQVSQRLADIRHQFLILEGSIPEVIVQAAVDCGATDIIVGKCDRSSYSDALHSDALSKEMFQVLIENSSLPVTVVGETLRSLRQ